MRARRVGGGEAGLAVEAGVPGIGADAGADESAGGEADAGCGRPLATAGRLDVL
jgi:hypothetical protein